MLIFVVARRQVEGLLSWDFNLCNNGILSLQQQRTETLHLVLQDDLESTLVLLDSAS